MCCTPAAQRLLQALLAALACPPVDDEDVERKAVGRVERVRLADVQPQVAHHLRQPAEQLWLIC